MSEVFLKTQGEQSPCLDTKGFLQVLVTRLKCEALIREHDSTKLLERTSEMSPLRDHIQELKDAAWWEVALSGQILKGVDMVIEENREMPLPPFFALSLLTHPQCTPLPFEFKNDGYDACIVPGGELVVKVKFEDKKDESGKDVSEVNYYLSPLHY